MRFVVIVKDDARVGPEPARLPEFFHLEDIVDARRSVTQHLGVHEAALLVLPISPGEPARAANLAIVLEWKQSAGEADDVDVLAGGARDGKRFVDGEIGMD